MDRKILVVDDENEAVDLMRAALESGGYEVIAAYSGKQALQMAQTEDPDLVVLDIMMPDLDGYEVSRRLRSRPGTAHLPILMYTAKTQLEDKVTGFQAGADDYLTKPILPQELVSRVESLLLRASLTQPREEAPPSNVVGFLGSKGGAGTTTLLVNTAVAMSRGADEDRSVALAELRGGLATAALQLGFPRPGDITRILEQPPASIDTALVEAQLDQHGTGLLALTGQTVPPGVAERVSPDHAEAIVKRLTGIADYVLLDLGVGLDEVNRRLLPRCRRIVVTIEPNRLSVALAEDLLDEMNESLNIPSHKIILVLINRSRSTGSLTKSTIEETLRHSL
ncbi:MAG: response regulator, partial [Anaerolineae bacterium]